MLKHSYGLLHRMIKRTCNDYCSLLLKGIYSKDLLKDVRDMLYANKTEDTTPTFDDNNKIVAASIEIMQPKDIAKSRY